MVATEVPRLTADDAPLPPGTTRRRPDRPPPPGRAPGPRPDAASRTVRAAIATAVATLGLAMLAALAQERHNDQLVAAATADLARQVADRMLDRLDLYVNGLRGLESTVAAVGADRFDRTAFERWALARDVTRHFPRLHGIGFVRRVTEEGRPEFEAAMRRDYGGSFRIRQFAPWDGERRIVTHVTPASRNAGVVGLDLASDPVRRSGMDQAVERRDVAVSAPLTLVSVPAARGSAVALALPVTQPVGQPGALPEVIGWAYAVLVLPEILDMLDGIGNTFELRLTDRDDRTDAGTALFRSRHGGAADADVVVRRLQVYGRTWEMELQPTERLVHGLNLTAPATTAALVSIMALLLAACAHLALTARSRAASAAAERARRAALVERSSDAIVGLDARGHIDDWNDGAEAMLGLVRARALGRHWSEVLRFEPLDADGRPSDADSLAQIDRLIALPPASPVEARVHHDGTRVVAVSVAVTPLGPPSGRDARVGVAMVMRDITALKAAQAEADAARARLEQEVERRTAALRDSERLLQATSRIAHVGGWRLDFADDQVTWTEETRRMHGTSDAYRPTLEAGLAFYEPESRARLADALRDARAGRIDSWDLELGLDNTAGRRRWVRVLGMVEREQGRPVALAGTIQDITEQHEARVELANARARFAVAARAASLGVWERHLIDNTRAWDEGMHALHGTDPARGVPSFEDWAARVHPDDLPRVAHALQAAVEGDDRLIEVDLRVRRADGQQRLLHTTATVQRDREGRAVSLIGVDMDVTEVRRAAQALETASSLLRGVLDAAIDVAIVATGLDDRITLFNRGAERMFGWSAADVVGQHTADVYLDMRAVEAAAAALEIDTGRPIRGLELFRQPEWTGRAGLWPAISRDGRHLEIRQTVTPIRRDDGEVIGRLAVSTDNTVPRRVEQALIDARRAAEDASAAKSRFIGNMSHEIRTPMNGVIGLAELLAATPLSPEQADLVGRLVAVADSLMTILNDVLDLSKIEAGELLLDPVDFSLRDLIDDLDAGFGHAAVSGARLLVSLPSDLPDAWHGDVWRIRQVLTNLLSNASKFSPRGQVVLSVSAESGDPPGSGFPAPTQMHFVVVDNGIGMSSRQMERLFTPFAQGDRSIARRFGGTGLGLAIVRELVQLMDGRIDVSSREGAGSRFDVRLPLAPAIGPVRRRHVRTQDTPAAPLQGLRLLVVDDSELNRLVATKLAQRLGAEVRAVDGGEAALHHLAEHPHDVDAVLMDVQMPGLDGCETTRRLRARPQTADLPVIALTAGVLVSERNEAIASGMNGFIAKPFTSSTLLQGLLDAGVLASPAAGRAADGPPPTPGDPATAGRLVTAAAGGDARPRSRATAHWPQLPGVDVDRAFASTGGDSELFLHLVALMLKDLAAATPAMIDEAGYWHRLRGGASILGATGLQVAASRAEDAVKASDPDELSKAQEQVRAFLAVFLPAAEALLAARRSGDPAGAGTRASDVPNDAGAPAVEGPDPDAQA